MTARMLSARGRRRWPWAAGLLSVLAASGCAGFHREHAKRKIPQLGVVDCTQPRELRMVSHPRYVVEPPDELDVQVKPEVQELNGSYTVRADGVIDLGFAGDVYLAGLTLAEAEEKIAQHLLQVPGVRPPKEGYRVSVRLANTTQSKYYYVLGTVSTQGRYPSTGNETVLDAVLTAGLRANSVPEKAYLVRPHPEGGPDQVLRIDWVGIKDRGDTTTNYQVFPGDRIIVPGTKPPGLIGSLVGG